MLKAASDRTIGQFAHTGWTAKEGAPGGVSALAQTTDGFLWGGSPRGLYRFDGVTFEPYQPESGPAFPSLYVTALLAAPNGDLWIGYLESGISLLRGGRNANFGPAEGFPQGRVWQLARDHEGTVWAATSAGLARFEKGRWEPIGADWNCSCHAAYSVYVDRQGTLWAGTEDTIVFLQRGTRSFRPTGYHLGQIHDFAESGNGTLWIAEPGRSVRPLLLSGTSQSSSQPEIRVGSIGILFDGDGSLWITSIGDGLRRVPSPDSLHHEVGEFSPAAESFTLKDGLTSDYVLTILKDREGSIWIGTSSGLDRFHRGAFIPVSLPSKFARTLLIPGNQGEVWVGTPSAAIARIRGNTFEMVGDYGGFCSGFRDTSGIVWLLSLHHDAEIKGGGLSVIRVEDGKMGPTSLVPGTDSSGVLAKDGSGTLWSSVGTNNVVYQDHERWLPLHLPAGMATKTALVGYTDSGGRVWFGFTNNAILKCDRTNSRVFALDNGVQVGSVRAIQERAGRFWIGGELGLEVLEGNRFRAVLPRDTETFKGVSGIVAAADGSMWLSENRGALRIGARELSKALEQPSYRVLYEVFDTRDGLPGDVQETQPYPTSIQGTDGRVWFAASGGVAWVDPAHLPRNPLPPPVSIRSVVANERRYHPVAALELPALTHNVQIDYSALSLAIPERVRFRYQLEGSDKDWQDAGTRRQAFYTNLGPGPYRFRVIACNNDGVWNEKGASWSFRIAPAFYQTRWFEVLCALGLVLLLAAAHRLRTRQIAAVLKARLDDRVAERTRIARDFHDTLLQTLQGSKIVADDALKHRTETDRMERALERLSQWLAQATEEGRSALTSLRSSFEEANNLADAFQQACRECSPGDSFEFRVSVDGGAREVHPIVRDEVYRIGSEAIRNACLHSSASQLRVELDYRNGLIMRVGDNGKGMDPNLAATSKTGHFGMLGMYERAARIRGKLTISSNPENGTQVELVVPPSVAFPRSGNSGRWFRIFPRFFGK